jgi:hypothetical protein
MELKYCENCGDVIVQAESGAGKPLAERFVCKKCRSSPQPATSRPEPAARGAEAQAHQRSPQKAEAADLLQGEPLDLFSKRTIALRRSQTASTSEVAPARSSGAGLPELAEPSDLELTEKLHPPELREPPVAAGESSQRPQPSSDAGGSLEFLVPIEDGDEGDLVGSAVPAPRAQKILFRCLHCKSPVSIRPVSSTSRLNCPSCQNSIYVTVSGQLFRSLPSISATTPGSVRLASGAEETSRTDAREVSLRPTAQNSTARGPSDSSHLLVNPSRAALRAAPLLKSNPKMEAGGHPPLPHSGSSRGGAAARGADSPMTASAPHDGDLLQLELDLDTEPTEVVAPRSASASANTQRATVQARPGPAGSGSLGDDLRRDSRPASRSAPQVRRAQRPAVRRAAVASNEKLHAAAAGANGAAEEALEVPRELLEPSPLPGRWAGGAQRAGRNWRPGRLGLAVRTLVLTVAVVLPHWVLVAVAGTREGTRRPGPALPGAQGTTSALVESLGATASKGVRRALDELGVGG